MIMMEFIPTLPMENNEIKIMEQNSSKKIPNDIQTIINQRTLDMEGMSSSLKTKHKKLIEYLTKFPWDINTSFDLRKGKTDEEFLSDVQTKLDSKIIGQNSAKLQFKKFVAAMLKNNNSFGKSFGLIGPPGVGKTTLAITLAESLGLPNCVIPLGGNDDSNTLIGCEYTYDTSEPGLILKKIISNGTTKMIFIFDELDKTSKFGSNNKIQDILINLTDLSTNHSFRDRYFNDVLFPLQNVIFIFTYNDKSNINKILLDRFDEIELEDLTLENKIEITNKILIPSNCEKLKIDQNLIKFDEKYIKFIIENNVDGNGRELSREIEKIFLEINLKLIEKSISLPIQISNEIFCELKKFFDSTKIIKQKNIIGQSKTIGFIVNDKKKIECSSLNIQVSKNHLEEILLISSEVDVSIKHEIFNSFNFLLNNCNNKKRKLFGNEILKYIVNIQESDSNMKTKLFGKCIGLAFSAAFISYNEQIPISNTTAFIGTVDLLGNINNNFETNDIIKHCEKIGIKKLFLPLNNKKNFSSSICIKYIENIKDVQKMLLSDFLEIFLKK